MGSLNRPQPVRIEPGERLVVLARTLDAQDLQAEATLEAGARDPVRFGETCLGRALYRHRSVYRGASDVAVWSHLAVDYYRDLVPEEAIRTLAFRQQPAGVRLLRAELLLTTPASFVLPPGWQGSVDTPERQVSLEYIHVGADHLGAYRDAMRDYCGPAATRLVRSGRFGTFRAMETAAVLTQAPGFAVDWNQIHICELDPDGFQGFGQEFEAALCNGGPDTADASNVFAGLDALRTVTRWTFNDAVVEMDSNLARSRGR
jgi:hypothetical protein